MLRFTSPEWLILAPLAILAGWYWKNLRLADPLRALCLGVLLFLLLGPQLRKQSAGLDIWVLTDRSASCADLVEPRAAEMQSLLERSKGREDRIHWLDFADLVQPRQEKAMEDFTGRRNETRLNLAIQFALARADGDRATRLLAITDGFGTEPLSDASERLQAQGVALDYRLVTQPDAPDFRVAALDVPARVQRDEPFLLQAEIEGEADGPVPFTVLRDGAGLAKGTASVREGRATIRYTDRLASSGAHRYEVRLAPEQDAFPGNNHADRWVESAGGPRVLLVTAYADDPLIPALRGQGFELDVEMQPAQLNAGRLSGAKAVILNNVPAYRVSHDFLTALDFYVRNQGGGLLMAGGKYSFGAGGYFQSPVDPLLPVSMELKQEHRKLSVAMAIILDRSGSMSCGVPGGRPGLSKMDLADEGAARAIELLGGMDAVSVIAVDSQPHTFVPLTKIGENRDQILNATRRIRSQGGGIFCYTGLRAGWKEIKDAPFGQKHIILFADAADAEEPGDYINLLAEITKAGGTVSVIGMGTDRDVDAAFLIDVAKRGNGRMFFCEAGTLPEIFAQETVAVSRSAFLDEATPFQATAGWLELAARPLGWLKAVDGYNLSYLRDGATAAALSGDEYAAPLIAFWQRGLGRVGAISFPVGGAYSQAVRAWDGFADMNRTVARWLMGRETPPGLGLRVNRIGTVIQVELLYDRRWEEKIAVRGPELMTVEGSSDRVATHIWQRLEPGHYVSAIQLDDERWLRGAIQVADAALPFGPVNAGGTAEWQFDRARVAELKQVSARSGGEERVDLSAIWKAPRKKEFVDIRPYGLVLFLSLFLVEALLTRIGWSWSAMRRPPAAEVRKRATAETGRRVEAPSRPVFAKVASAKPPVSPAATPPGPVAGPQMPPSLPKPPAAGESRRSLFDRAKRGG